MDDDQIVTLYLNRKEEAIKESDLKYGKLLHRISFHILSNQQDSEECVNDTYCNVWESIPPQKPRSLGAYMGRIVRNLSINRWYENRTQKRGGNAEILLSELSDCIPSNNTVEADVNENELTNLINLWLLSLAKDDRVLFLRRYWYGDSVKALAMECGVTQSMMAGRIYRLRQKLKALLLKEGIFL